MSPVLYLWAKAAQHLHIAQPALSMAVTRLEEE
ncbi:helix-turn-helix domain-containing protein, partial [Pseudomonas fortuita]